MRPPYRDRYGVWNIEDKPKPPNKKYRAEVEAKVERSADVGGWKNGPVFVTSEMADEAIDIAGWARGLDKDSLSPAQSRLLDSILDDAEELYGAIMRLRQSF